MEILKAKLRTGGKTRDQIISEFEGDINEEEIKAWQHAYNLIDGKEIVVAQLFKDRYTPVSWLVEDDAAFRDFIYQVEQDDWFGTYGNERQEFLKDWENEEYEPSGSLSFCKDDVEIIKRITRS